MCSRLPGFRLFRARLVPALLSAGLAAAAGPSLGDSVAAVGGEGLSARASIQIRVVIPSMMRVLENSHPLHIEPEADGSHRAQQRIVVQSNLKRGFCVTLRVADAQRSGWRLQTAPPHGLQLDPIADGYRLCGPQPGPYTLLLNHHFASTNTSPAEPVRLGWPVMTEISAR